MREVICQVLQRFGIVGVMMKKLFLKGLLFCIIIFSVVVCFIYFSTREPTRSLIARWTNSEDFMAESGMLSYFARAKEANGSTRLIIGDSIANQLFSGLQAYNSKTDILTTNAALMITGQYLLAEEYIKNHPDATDIFLVIHPLALTRTFDTEWGYRYAAMTYVETDTIDYLDENTINAMASVYGTFFMQKNIVGLIEDSPVCRKLYLSYIDINGEDYIQESPFEIADQYVKKLYDLCLENQIELHVYPSPVSEYFKNQVMELSEGYGNTWMSTKFPDYFNQIMFYPDAWSEDLSHFGGEYAERGQLNEIIRQAYGQTALSQLHFE